MVMSALGKGQVRGVQKTYKILQLLHFTSKEKSDKRTCICTLLQTHESYFTNKYIVENVLGMHSLTKTINQSGFDNEARTQLALCNCNHIKRASGVVIVTLVEKHLSKHLLTKPCIISSNKKSQPHFTLTSNCIENILDMKTKLCISPMLYQTQIHH